MMALSDWFPTRSALQLALERGTQPGGDLHQELKSLGKTAVRSKADANAVCSALEKTLLKTTEDGQRSYLSPLINLFQQIDQAQEKAVAVLIERGTKLLIQLVENHLLGRSPHDPDNILFALKILAMYQTKEGSRMVVRAALHPLAPESYFWRPILHYYDQDHTWHEQIYAKFRKQLPPDFIAISLLDAANHARLNGANFPHPFDSPEGLQQLEDYLTCTDEELYSYAVSATVALLFITDSKRAELLSLAIEHPYPKIQLEAAWVSAHLKQPSGVKTLKKMCMDVNLSNEAKQYLQELGLSEEIPQESLRPEFAAMSEFSKWLSHPNELGQAPDELQVINHRILPWPPEMQKTPLWLIQYRLRDKTGLRSDDVDIGLVGGITFCLFSYHLTQRAPDDIYAIYCYWTASVHNLLESIKVEEGDTEYNTMLNQSRLEGITDCQIIEVVEFSHSLDYPQPVVALARARQHDQPGWLVLDGPRSHFYSAKEMLPDEYESLVLHIHTGRVLLGFKKHPERAKYHLPPPAKKPPEDIIAAYEKLIDQASSSDTQAEKLIGNGHSPLVRSFEDYVSALVEVRSISPAKANRLAYEKFLTLTSHADLDLQNKLLSSFDGIISSYFSEYASALIELKENEKVLYWIKKLQPQWDHTSGYSLLGTVAHQAGYEKLAEMLLIKFRKNCEGWCRGEETDLLAEIWAKQGQPDRAKSLLLTALKMLLAQSRDASSEDRALFQTWYETRLNSYLKLFPEENRKTLKEQGIPGKLPQKKFKPEV